MCGCFNLNSYLFLGKKKKKLMKVLQLQVHGSDTE